ncbi:MAG: DNA polymerase III, subunit gamma and tau [Epulopiscium sp. Nuni2H_MBin003]|nr:MAG: DNA polymerase III, subunit gamma and tau [Epulopiscium sp. Nuni2H_MBin003]
MSYLTLYRKYRPKKFADLVGQEHITRTLSNQIKLNRIAHAYLFTGGRGTGKTTVAKIFAKAINCDTPIDGMSCLECETCQKIDSGAGINIVEMDAASHNGVDDIRDINEQVRYTPTVGKYKVYIIDEVHMLSNAAFNAMLKTLEEPPSYVVFILATTDPQKIPATVLSRCQRYDFRRISTKDITQCLEEYMHNENVAIALEALEFIARLADGGMRDALSILEQCISFYNDEAITLDKVLYLVGAVDTQIFFDIMDILAEQDATQIVSLCSEINNQGRNIRQFTKDLSWHIRNLLVAKTTDTSTGLLDYTKEHIQKLVEQAGKFEIPTLMRYIKIFSELDQEMKVSNMPKITLEIAMIKLCTPQSDLSAESIHDKIIALENRVEKLKVVTVETKHVEKPAPALIPPAIPAEYKEIVDNWNKVLDELSVNPMQKSLVMTYSIEVMDDTIYIVHPDRDSTLAQNTISYIQEALYKVWGKEFKVATKKESETNLQVAPQNTLAELQGRVNFPITSI